MISLSPLPPYFIFSRLTNPITACNLASDLITHMKWLFEVPNEFFVGNSDGLISIFNPLDLSLYHRTILATLPGTHLSEFSRQRSFGSAKYVDTLQSPLVNHYPYPTPYLWVYPRVHLHPEALSFYILFWWLHQHPKVQLSLYRWLPHAFIQPWSLFWALVSTTPTISDISTWLSYGHLELNMS